MILYLWNQCGKVMLKASDPGKAFLTFPTLPIMIASYLHLGGACPPHWDLLHLDKFLVEMEGGVGGGGGGWAHPPVLATLGKMALGASVGFLGIGQSD